MHRKLRMRRVAMWAAVVSAVLVGAAWFASLFLTAVYTKGDRPAHAVGSALVIRPTVIKRGQVIRPTPLMAGTVHLVQDGVLVLNWHAKSNAAAPPWLARACDRHGLVGPAFSGIDGAWLLPLWLPLAMAGLPAGLLGILDRRATRARGNPVRRPGPFGMWPRIHRAGQWIGIAVFIASMTAWIASLVMADRPLYMATEYVEMVQHPGALGLRMRSQPPSTRGWTWIRLRAPIPGNHRYGFVWPHRRASSFVGLTFIPLWLPLVASAAAVAVCRRAERRRAASGNCPTCGYDLRASGRHCPECGADTPLRAKQPCRVVRAEGIRG